MIRLAVILTLSVAALLLSNAALARCDEVVRWNPHKILAAKTTPAAIKYRAPVKTGK